MMQATTIDRTNPLQSAVVLLTTLAAVALLGLVLAYWTWAWLAPSPELQLPATPSESRASDPTQGAYVLFGGAGRSGSVAAPAASAGTIRLLGIVAASAGRPGYAVLRLDGKQTLAVPQGAEVEPGLRLADVQVDHVVLERNGGRETLGWPQKAAK